MWTGDNLADWRHLEKSIPMLLTLSLSNYVFVGADVGGFFKNPTAELMTRWYQAATFYPFFRAHAHLETKRREPWLFGEDSTNRFRDAIALRYVLLPYLYTNFFIAHDTGAPVMRPMFYEFPHDTTFADEQMIFMSGRALLVAPVLKEGQSYLEVKFPPTENFFAFPTGEPVAAGTSYLNVPVTLDAIPVFQRGGTIVPARLRLRRSTKGMVRDPYTLYVALNAEGNSHGHLYEDDTHTFKFEHGAYVFRSLSFSGDRLTNAAAPAQTARPRSAGLYTSTNTVERIIIWGLKKSPKRITAQYSAELPGAGNVGVQELTFSVGNSNSVVVRKPDLFIDADWTLDVHY